MTARLLVAVLCVLFAAPALAEDPDGGVARAYYSGLDEIPLAEVKPTGKKAGNVIWIVVDALRPDHLSCYGYDKPTTPFLKSLAGESLTFLNAYTNAPWTRPSTASMLSGLLPSAHRTQSDKSRLPAEIHTVGQDFQRLGYQTAAVVGNGNAGSIAGLDRGFEYYVDTVKHWDSLPDAGTVYDEARTWLKKERKPDQPFFLYLFLIDPHDPYRAPPEYEKKWLGPDFKGEPRRRAHWEYKNDYPKAERDSMIAVYDASIRYMDDQTRAFFETLEKRGLLEDTTIVFTADHGEGFGEHGYYLHAHHHYDEIVRVPLIIKSPALSGTGYVPHLTQLVDLRPTLVDLAGGKPHGRVDGTSLKDLLAKPVDRDRLVYTEYHEFGIRRSSVLTLKNRVILQLPADGEAFDARIPDRKLLPSVNFDHEVVHIYDRVADPLDRKPIPLKKASPEARTMYQRLKKRMQIMPPSNIATRKIPASVIDELESLGYTQ